MLAQQRAGMILCLCSKNGEQDVCAVFERNPHMLLRLQDFAALRVNWEPKSQNLLALADELQLGLDSFIFLDDNPLECEEVRSNCPEVLTSSCRAIRKRFHSCSITSGPSITSGSLLRTVSGPPCTGRMWDASRSVGAPPASRTFSPASS